MQRELADVITDLFHGLQPGGAMQITRKEAQQLGIEGPPARRKGKTTMPADDGVRRLFFELCKAHGLPKPHAEYQFTSERKWRLDWAWPGLLIALEVEGGVWTNGAHVRGKHFLSDMEKYNAAAILGWTILRCVPADIDSGAGLALVGRAIEAKGELA